METMKRICTSAPMLATVIAVMAGLVAMGCSSTQNEGAEEPTNGTSGGISDFDDPLNAGSSYPEESSSGETGEADTGEGEGSDESYSGGTGRLKLKVLQSSEPARGDVRILTADVEPTVVREGTSAETFELKAGRYDVEVSLDTTIDHPMKRLQAVPIKAGELTERELDFTIGTIVLRPKRGNAVVNSKIRWRYAGGGDWFEGTSQTGEETTLSTGRYDAEITLGRTEIVIEDIQVYEGKRTVSPPVQMTGR